MAWRLKLINASLVRSRLSYLFAFQIESKPSTVSSCRLFPACNRESRPTATATPNCIAEASTPDWCWRRSQPTSSGPSSCCTRSSRCKSGRSECPSDKAETPFDMQWSHAIAQHSEWFCFCKPSLTKICGSAWRFLWWRKIDKEVSEVRASKPQWKPLMSFSQSELLWYKNYYSPR